MRLDGVSFQPPEVDQCFHQVEFMLGMINSGWGGEDKDSWPQLPVLGILAELGAGSAPLVPDEIFQHLPYLLDQSMI